ncbi:hypothetical protein BJ508DRAFT_411386 [Ascobolus immersus RN42]|uniref:TROVE domain-containing protein n=1 Tax=Ascobolus immersus RN42 TaxID=1160509 RepID=A0A3N4IJ74_ASCIM|nr:hypothetical protein BJ508DRAFT_411386 [Ascobolus immersus RN42]
MIIPANLSRPQHDLVFRQRHHHLLAGENTKVNVKGEEITLRPKLGISAVNRTTYSKALDLMKDKEDFMTIPSLIEAFYQAGRTLREPLMERTVRKLVAAEQWEALIHLWEKAPVLDFHITKHMIRESMRGFYLENEAAQESKATKGPKHGRRLLKILQSMEESGDKRLAEWAKANNSISKDQVVVGTVFAMTCNNSVRFFDGSDSKGYCEHWTAELKKVWVKAKVEGKPANKHEAKHAVTQYSPILSGLESAQKVVKGDLLKFVAEETTRLQKAIKSWEKIAGEAATK